MNRTARLTPMGRLTLCLRIEGGRPIAHVAAEMGISRATASKWWHRWLVEGAEGLVDRSSRPHTSPTRTSAVVEAQIAGLRRTLKLGPARIGYRLGVAASTVHRVLCRLGLNRLTWMDWPHRPGHPPLRTRPAGRAGAPGRQEARSHPRRRRLEDPRTRQRRLQGPQPRRLRLHPLRGRRPLPAGLQRGPPRRGPAHLYRVLAARPHLVRRTGRHYRRGADRQRQRLPQQTVLRRPRWLKHRRTKPYCPKTNGKVERFDRTLLEEWAYVRPYFSEQERTSALADWLQNYNHHRSHTALGGRAPIPTRQQPA
jgi:hypothetical protein